MHLARRAAVGGVLCRTTWRGSFTHQRVLCRNACAARRQARNASGYALGRAHTRIGTQPRRQAIPSCGAVKTHAPGRCPLRCGARLLRQRTLRVGRGGLALLLLQRARLCAAQAGSAQRDDVSTGGGYVAACAAAHAPPRHRSAAWPPPGQRTAHAQAPWPVERLRCGHGHIDAGTPGWHGHLHRAFPRRAGRCGAQDALRAARRRGGGAGHAACCATGAFLAPTQSACVHARVHARRPRCNQPVALRVTCGR